MESRSRRHDCLRMLEVGSERGRGLRLRRATAQCKGRRPGTSREMRWCALGVAFSDGAGGAACASICQAGA